MLSRRALLSMGAALCAASALTACGSSDPPAGSAAASLPNYAGQGGNTTFDGAWLGQGYSQWRIDVKDGVFTGTGEGKGLSSWTGAMTGFIRKDHTVEGMARSGSDPTAYPITGTWPRLELHWANGPPSVVRASRI